MSGLLIDRVGSSRMFTTEKNRNQSNLVTSSTHNSSCDDNPHLDSSNSLFGMLSNTSKFIECLNKGISKIFAGMSNIILGGEGDFYQLMIKNTKFQAALGLARNFWEWIIEQLKQKNKALASAFGLAKAV